MSIPGQPPPSAPLQVAVRLLAKGEAEKAEETVTVAARRTKAEHGSGSPPLARAYADMARVHYRMGEFKKAAAEFKHACEGPMPTDLSARRDRLSFMFGYACCLEALDQGDAAEKVYRQCVIFAKNLNGPGTPGYAVSLVPLADRLLKAKKIDEAAKLMDEAYNILWNKGDQAITTAIPVRAETLVASGRSDSAFHDLGELPDELVNETVGHVITRSKTSDPVRMRQVLANLLQFLDKKYGVGHPATSDTLAAITHHETGLGIRADTKIRISAARRALWAFATQKLPGDLLANLEVGFEEDGTIHIVPHLTREAADNEMVKLEEVLTLAVDDLYSRPKKVEASEFA